MEYDTLQIWQVWFRMYPTSNLSLGFQYNKFIPRFALTSHIKKYSLRPTKSVVLEFKFCPTKSLVLACNEIYLIKIIPSTKKALHRKTHRANQIFSRYYFSSSNAYAFIEDQKTK